MRQLKALDSLRPEQQKQLPSELCCITTPLIAATWEEALRQHPAKQFRDYVVSGIKSGFRVGFDYTNHKLVSSKSNMLSASSNPQIIEEYLQHEVSLGRMWKPPLALVALRPLQVSPIGVIPKKHKPGKWRLIVDLSAPEGSSVNDGIDKDTCSLSYVSIDKIVDCILEVGRGVEMAKIDIKEAYRNIPVHPEDRPLLGVRWQNELYLDNVLPFGLRSAPLIFTAVADALQWIIERRGVCHIFHYLDDYITIARPGAKACSINLKTIKQACADLGVPVEEAKCVGPATTIQFIVIELDSVALEICLPEDKLLRLRALLQDWKGRKAGKKRDLLSLIGTLNHAAKVVQQGRSFLRRLIDLSSAGKHLDNYIRLNVSARSDIRWWGEFAEAWNGISMMVRADKLHPQLFITSDASGSWGYGAYCGDSWFQFSWVEGMEGLHITIKELIPVVMAAAIWGLDWAGKSVRLQCDNAAVVAIVNSGSSRDQDAMHLLRCLAFITATFGFTLSASHIRGVDNDLADALSRNNLAYFHCHYPQANPFPMPIPPPLVELLVRAKPDWTSASWTKLWSSIFKMP